MKIKINSSLFFLLALSFLLTSCIELIEELTINKDRSGTLSYRIETHGGGDFLNGLSGLFSNSIEDQLILEAEKLIQELKTQPGISNLRYNLQGGAGSFYLQFDFDKHGSINSALYAISGYKKSFFSPGYIKISRSHLKKMNFTPWLNRYLEKEEIDFQSPFITDHIYFKSIVRVPDDINRARPEGLELGRSGRETQQKFRLTDILEGSSNTGIKIRY